MEPKLSNAASQQNARPNEPGIRYIAMLFNAWDKIQALTPFPVAVHPLGKSVGFMLVYDSLDDLHRDYPHADYTAVELKTPPPKIVRIRRNTKGKNDSRQKSSKRI